VLRNPTIQEVADCLGLNPKIDRTAVCDLVIIGADRRPRRGRVRGVGRPERRDDRSERAGGSGTSSRIENYLGFPLGISGQELAARAYDQAQKFARRSSSRKSPGSTAARTVPRTVQRRFRRSVAHPCHHHREWSRVPAPGG